MEKFSLKEYLKNPDRKVVTKSGDEATIIYTKANKEWPVVALINSSTDAGLVWQFSADGESMPDNDGSIYYGGLFFADEEEELTEFDDELDKYIDAVDARTNGRWAEDDIIEMAKHFYDLGLNSKK